MEKPFQKDINFLKEELAHHEYIARKYKQEYDRPHAAEFEALCEEIRAAIKIMESRQATAVSEWSALSASKRRAILLPLFEALETTVANAKGNNCPEFAHYLNASLDAYLIDLQNYKEK